MQTQLETTLAELVAIPSVTSDPIACHEVLQYVREALAPLDLHITTNPQETPHPWLIATTQSTMQPDILLAAHLDVVPAGPEAFIMQKRDGKLYGRGTYDMKLATACYLEFFKAHADKLHDMNIGILFTTDEEGGGASMKDVMATGLRPGTVFIPDGGDDWHVEKRAKGLYGVELTSYGKTAHGSRPWEGKNALNTMLDILQLLRIRYPSKERSEATLSIGTLHAGEAINQVPATATAALDFRSFSKTELAEFKELIDNLVKSHDLSIKYINIGDPLLFDETRPAVQGFLSALRKQTGKEDIDFCESYGASDARYFAEYDIPCIIMEPHGGLRHADGEWLEADDLGNYYRLIERWLLAAESEGDEHARHHESAHHEPVRQKSLETIPLS